MSQNKATMKTILLFHMIHRVFHNSILVVRIAGDLMKPFSVNQRMKIVAMSKILATILILLVLTIIPACCDDDDDDDSAITPILSTEEPVDSLSMGDEHLDTIPATESDEKHEEEQANDARYWKIPACSDDDNDYNFAITPNEPVDSLSMGDEHLDTVSAMESDEFIKSCVENLVPNPSEFEGENGCVVPACSTTFSNVIFNADYEFDSSD
nr:hypothetical protein [Tanacetum cinerariifolium]